MAVALSPSLTVAMTPCKLRCTWWSLRPGWLLNLSLTGMYAWTFLLWTLAVPRDWVDLPSPSSHFQDSVSCLTCSQDSQLLRHPAIDIVWRWPCLPRFRLRCAWWPFSLGWFLNLFLQRMNVMTFLSWTLDLGTGSGINTHECVCVVLCPCSLLCYSLLTIPAHPAIHVNVWNRAI